MISSQDTCRGEMKLQELSAGKSAAALCFIIKDEESPRLLSWRVRFLYFDGGRIHHRIIETFAAA